MKKLNVLLIEDKDNCINFASTVFKKHDIDYQVVKNCKDAESLLEYGNFDFVICDYHLFDETTEEIVKRYCNKFYFYANSDEEGNNKRLVELGCREILGKNHPERLIKLIVEKSK